MRGAALLSQELQLLLKQGWIGEVPTTHSALCQRLQQYKLLTSQNATQAFADTDRSWFTTDPQPYANLPHDIGFGERMTIPTMHAVALEALAPALGSGSRKVLDVGCGAGFLTCCLAKMSPDGDVIGLDLNEKLIGKAKSHPKIPKNVSFRRADVREVVDDEYDAIHVGFNIDQSLADEFTVKLRTGGLLWAPVATEANKAVMVRLIDSSGGFRDVIDMEYSPIRLPVSDFEDRLKAIEAEIKAIHGSLLKKLGRTLTIKDYPASIHPLLKERQILQAKIKRLSS